MNVYRHTHPPTHKHTHTQHTPRQERLQKDVNMYIYEERQVTKETHKENDKRDLHERQKRPT